MIAASRKLYGGRICRDPVSRTMGNHGKSDLDDVVTPGVYTVRSSVKHIPNGASVYAVLFVIVAESGVCSQFYVPNGGTSLYWRTSWSGDFLEWRECKGSAQSIASDPSIPDGKLS